MDIIKIIEKINEVGLSNNDITRYGDGFEDAIFKVKEVITELYKETQALQLQQTGVVCSLCYGNGYTIEVEAECCRNFNDYGCCGVPDPVQVQKQCYCSGGELPI